ncbi:hypothetical protein KGV52_01235 [Candidatus Gracilibacteria bacterium]|nr:hypothetical protein [Candidatus Gracilibacteria bacterium]
MSEESIQSSIDKQNQISQLGLAESVKDQVNETKSKIAWLAEQEEKRNKEKELFEAIQDYEDKRKDFLKHLKSLGLDIKKEEQNSLHNFWIDWEKNKQWEKDNYHLTIGNGIWGEKVPNTLLQQKSSGEKNYYNENQTLQELIKEKNHILQTKKLSEYAFGYGLESFTSFQSCIKAIKNMDEKFLHFLKPSHEYINEIIAYDESLLEKYDFLQKELGYKITSEAYSFFLQNDKYSILLDYPNLVGEFGDIEKDIFEIFKNLHAYDKIKIIDSIIEKSGKIPEEYKNYILQEKNPAIINTYFDFLSPVDPKILDEVKKDIFLNGEIKSDLLLQNISISDCKEFLKDKTFFDLSLEKNLEKFLSILSDEDKQKLIQYIYEKSDRVEQAFKLCKKFNIKLYFRETEEIGEEKPSWLFSNASGLKNSIYFYDYPIKKTLLKNKTYYNHEINEEGKIVFIEKEKNLSSEELKILDKTIKNFKENISLLEYFYNLIKKNDSPDILEKIQTINNSGELIHLYKKIFQLTNGGTTNLSDENLGNIEGLHQIITKLENTKFLLENINFTLYEYIQQNILDNPDKFENIKVLLEEEKFKKASEYQKNMLISFFITNNLENIQDSLEKIVKYDLFEYIDTTLELIGSKDIISDMISKKEFDTKIKEITSSDYLFDKFKWIIDDYIDNLKKTNNIFDELDFYKRLQKKFEYFHSRYEQQAIKDSISISFQIDNSKDFDTFLETYEKRIKLYETLLNSQSDEVKKLASSIFSQIVELENPEAFIEKIEQVFLENRLPYTGKLFRIFTQLYDEKKILDKIGEKSSPYLQRVKKTGNMDLMYNTFFKDLLKSHLYSGERSLQNFLQESVQAKKLYKKFDENHKLSKSEKDTLQDNLKTLVSMIQNRSIPLGEKIELSGDLDTDIELLKEELHCKTSQDVLGYFEKITLQKIGVSSFEEALKISQNSKIEKNIASRKLLEENNFELGENDLIKGFESKSYNLIGNLGFVSREFLGTEGESDRTPFDADLIKAKNNTVETLTQTLAKDYGDTFAVIKANNPDIVETTNDERIGNYKSHNFELFKTGALAENHYGIRTALPTTQIDYFVHISENQEKTQKFFFNIVKSGIYIPVINEKKEVIFSYEDFLDMQKIIFSGISTYTKQDFELNTEHTNPNIYSKIIQDLPKQEELDEVADSYTYLEKNIKNVLEKYGVSERKIGEKAKIGYEIQSTGSTGRNTFLTGKDANFDFDIDIKLDEKGFKHIENILQDFIKLFPSKNYTLFNDREDTKQILKLEALDENGNKLEVDLLFSKFKNDTVIDANKAIEQRLEHIQQTQSKEAYFQTLANIKAAKRYLKEKQVYKKMEHGQGGLGGIGIEVWILNNNGSFEQAAKTFLEAAIDDEGNIKNFSEFKNSYFIFGAGENIKRDGEVENFTQNLTPQGYEKMVKALKELA